MEVTPCGRTPCESHVIWTLSTCQTSLPPQDLCTCCLTTPSPSHLATSFSVQKPNVKTRDLIDRMGQYRTHACVLYSFVYMAYRKESAWEEGKRFPLGRTGSGGSTEGSAAGRSLWLDIWRPGCFHGIQVYPTVH